MATPRVSRSGLAGPAAGSRGVRSYEQESAPRCHVSGAGSSRHRGMLPRFVLGVATGLLAGLFVSLSPALVVVVIVAALILTFVGIARHADPLRSVFLAGLLVGAGSLLLAG